MQLIEIVRANRKDSFVYATREEHYKVRLGPGHYNNLSIDWSLENDYKLYEEIAAIYEDAHPRPARVKKFCNELRHLVDPAWELFARHLAPGVAGVTFTVCSDAAEVYTLPFELISTTHNSGQALGMRGGVALHYRWPGGFAAPASSGVDSGRVLVAWAAPRLDDARGCRQLTVPSDEHIERIERGQGEKLEFSRDDGDVISRVSLSGLVASLKRASPAPVRVLHLLCHGVRVGETYHLALHRDGLSEVDLVDAERLADALAPFASTLQLVVVCACSSGHSGRPGNHIGSVAQTLHRRGIAQVLASRFPLTFEASITLTDTLYRKLGAQGLRSVDDAVADARMRLNEKHGYAWASPQLYVAPREAEDLQPTRLVALSARDPWFVGRVDELNRLHHLLDPERDAGSDLQAPVPVVVTGSPGIGKSALAREYAHLCQKAFREIHWLDAQRDDLEQASQSYVAQDAGGARPRLLIVDGVNDVHAAIEALPSSASTRVLMTTRRRVAIGARELVLGPLDPRYAEALALGEKAYSAAELEELRRLCAALGHSPWALVRLRGDLAVGMNEPSDLLACLCEDGLVGLIDELDDPEIGGSLAELFAASVDPIKARADWAFALLRVAGALAPVEIPRALLLDAAARLRGETDAPRNLAKVAMRRLVRGGLARPGRRVQGVKSFVFGSLTHARARQIGGAAADRAALSALAAVGSTIADDERGLMQLAPFSRHCAIVIGRVKTSEDVTEEHHLLALRLARFYTLTAKYDDSLAICQRFVERADGAYRAALDLEAARAMAALGRHHEVLDRLHPDPNAQHPATTWRLIGESLARLGRYSDARAAFERGRAGHQETGGQPLADTLRSFAELLSWLGEYGQAAARCTEALAIYEEIGAREHPGQARALRVLGEVLRRQGRPDMALRHHSDAQEIQRATLGPDHPEAARITCAIGQALLERGRYGEAKERFEAAHTILTRTLGPEHPTTALALLALGQALCGLCEANGALSTVQAARFTLQRPAVAGPEHPLTALVLRTLGEVRRLRGEYDDARRCHAAALRLYKSSMGPEHPATGGAWRSLGITLRACGEYADACKHFERARSIHEGTLSADHPELARTICAAGVTLCEQGNYEGALVILDHALESLERAFPEPGNVGRSEHPDTAIALWAKGLALHGQGRYGEALRSLRRASAIQEAALGTNHRDTARTLLAIGQSMLARGEFSDARTVLRRAAVAAESVMGPEHPATAMALRGLGQARQHLGELDGARGLYIRASGILAERLGLGHPETALAQRCLGQVYSRLGRHEVAISALRRARVAQERSLGGQHPALAITLRATGEAELMRDAPDRALMLLEHARQIQHGALRAGHPETAITLARLGVAKLRAGQAGRPLIKDALEVLTPALGGDHPLVQSFRALVDTQPLPGD